ncbi:MAG: amidohydrolase [Bacteroidetes bacterium]|nr:amidohydrolase [Bacteroidota bacterium]MBL0257120.1 amidohydrolase [Bacteroidota bacterium]
MNRNVSLLLAITLLLNYSCSWTKKADLVLHHGIIYTVDNGFNIVEAMAVRNGKIIAIGKNDDILDAFETEQSIDLQGNAVYPGFIDGHCHFFGYGSDLVKCDLSGTTSFEEALEKIRVYAQTNKFEWILGRGWDQNDWVVKEFPTRHKLDSLFPDKPVYLMRIDGHAVLCNQVALSLAGITATTKIEGGEILLENGALTGVLIDNAVDLVRGKIPAFTKEMHENALLEAQKNCFAVGLTTVDDAGLGKDSIQLIDELQKSGKLKIRVYAMFSDEVKTREHFFEHGPVKTERLTVRAIKVYADGSLGSRGACLKKAYSDQPGHYGFLLNSQKYMKEIADEALENGFQVCTHAIGDSAVNVVLRIYADHLNGENNRRWRIEHCQVVDPKDHNYFGDYSIIPSVQPTHATSDMYWAEERLGKTRLANAYAYKELKEEAGGTIVFGTDFPVENINPLYTFYAAVERKDLKDFPSGGFQPENKIKKKDALRAMTIWAAYSNFEENEKGSLEEGKVADFVILDQDIMKVEGHNIPNTKVLATYVNGEKVFGK